MSRMAIYNSFIISNFNYCPVVWMFTSKSSLNNLENIQKRALRFVCNDFVSNYSDLLEKCGSQGVKLMTLRFMAIEVYKCVNNMNPQYLNEMFALKKILRHVIRYSQVSHILKILINVYKYYENYIATA